MPAISNITVKKNDGTTDITYSAVQPSSGDSVQAVWKSASVGSAQAHQPELRCSARDVQGSNAREVRFTFAYPTIATDTTTGLTSVVDQARGTFTLTFSKGKPSADVNEAVSQFANLLASAAAKAIVQSGYGPT